MQIYFYKVDLQQEILVMRYNRDFQSETGIEIKIGRTAFQIRLVAHPYQYLQSCTYQEVVCPITLLSLNKKRFE